MKPFSFLHTYPSKPLSSPVCRLGLLALLSLALLLPAACTQAPRYEGPVTVFESANVLPMDRDTVLTGQTVVVNRGRIAQMGPDGEVNIPADATRIDASGKYLMPGLAEMHGHVPRIQQGGSGADPGTYTEDVLYLYLAGGVTTVRGMQGTPGQLDLKAAVDSGAVTGPHLYLAGPPFTGNTVNSPEHAAERVRQQHEEGWYLLKVHEGLTTAEYDSMALTANGLGMPYGGHIPNEVGLEHALRTGQQTVDHLEGYLEFMDAMESRATDEQIQRAVDLSLETGVWVVPTMALWESIIGAADWEAMRAYEEVKYMPQQVIDGWENWISNVQSNSDPETAGIMAENRLRLLGALHEAGVPVLLGTDAPQIYSVPGFSIHREMPLMSKAGMSNYEILVSGTRTVGEYFAEEADFGTITEGHRADLLLVNANPLEDLSSIRDLAGVMVEGEWLPADAIHARLREIAARNSGGN